MIRYFTAHPTAANLLMLILVVMGLISLPEMKRETFPEFDSRRVQVSVAYPGASAEDVEEGVCRVLEDALDAVSDIDELRCEAREGSAVATAEMREGGDVRVFVEDIKSEVEAIDRFPDLIETPLVKELDRTDQVVSIAVTGPMSPPHLKAYCEQIKARLLAHGGIPQVSLSGFSEHQIRIEFRAEALRRYGLSAAAIADTIRKQSLDQPLGTLTGGEREILLRFAEQRRTPQEFEDLTVISGDSGAALRLGDIATVTDRFELEEDKLLFNGERACLLNITKNRTQDTLTVYHAVLEALERERAVKPPSVSLHITQDISSVVQDRLDLLLTNGWQGLLLVLATLWLFFGARFSLWVALGLPVSFLGAFFCMQWAGMSINMISMVALLVALGLLMDDAIVLAENIASHHAKGKEPLTAAIDGAQEVAPGVLSSFLTTLAVFGPLAFLSGDMGAVLKVIPIVLILVLAVSLIEAFWILPNHLAHSLHSAGNQREKRLRARFEGGLEWFREQAVGRAADWMVRWRYLNIGLIFSLFLISIGLVTGGHLKFQGFPSIDGDQIEARVLLPQGTPLSKTEAVVAELERALNEVNEHFKPRQPEQQDLVQNVRVHYGKNSDAYESGPHLATVSADLLTAEQRDARLGDVINLWREHSTLPPDVINVAFKEPAIGPAGRPIDIRLQGPDLAQLKQASRELQTWLSGYRGVSDLGDDLRPGKPELRLSLKDGALNLGLDADTIARQLRAAYFGTTAAEIQVGVEQYAIDIRLAAADRDQIADLENFSVRAPDGVDVPLTSVAEITRTRGYARIHSIDGQRTVTIQGALDTDLNNAGEILRDTRQRFLPDLAQRYPEVRVSFEGEAKGNQETGQSMLRALIIGLLGIFVVLSFEFRSYREPFLVMTIIPMALIGVFWGHWLMGLTLSMPSMIGLVSLAGIAVNDSILLVNFIKSHREQGMDPYQAAAQASRARFRAVLLTSATTIAGLLPILLEKSLQAQILIPLVASIAFGLLATTLLVLFLIPCLYAVFADWGWAREVEPEESSRG